MKTFAIMFSQCNNILMILLMLVITLQTSCVLSADNTYDEQVSNTKNMLADLRAQLNSLKEQVKNAESKKSEKETELNNWKDDYLTKKIPAFIEHGKTLANAYEPLFNEIISKRENQVSVAGKQHAKTTYGWFANGYERAINSSFGHKNWNARHVKNRYNEVTKHYYTDKIIKQANEIEKQYKDLVDYEIGGTRKEFVELGEKIESEVHEIGRRLKQVQFHEEYSLRSSGISGIMQIRNRQVGSKFYYSSTHNGNSIAAVHDHTNNKYTVGMGEFIAKINGVQFRTRHNDYRLKQAPHGKDKKDLEFIKFPEVPPAVLMKSTVNEQITEMKEWFRAFKEQNVNLRDYRPYFKPVLVYLEGGWTDSDVSGSIEEPFDSDRHFINAKSWLDLQEKIRFTSYTGSKSALENLAHLPTKINRFKDGAPVLAQWNYRIACHVLNFKEGETLPLDKIKLKLDTAAQMARGRSDKDYEYSRAAHFDLEGVNVKGERSSEHLDYTLLDELMEQIPGRDNYGADITSGDGDDTLYSAHPEKGNTKLNLGYYNRVYKKKGKSGKLETFGRFFNDRLWVAHTTNPKISQTEFNYTGNKPEGELKKQRVTFALPLEIIYLTPLQSWNPYVIPFLPKQNTPKGTGKDTDPFLQTTERSYYQTPLEFYNSAASEGNAADTARDFVYAKSDATKSPVKVTPSGISIFSREIAGVGKIRIRYPIMNVNVEGNPAYKYYEVLNNVAYDIKNPKSNLITVVTSPSLTTNFHTHVFQMTRQEYEDILYRRKEFKFLTETADGHRHNLKVKGLRRRDLVIIDCDSTGSQSDGTFCFDHHSAALNEKVQ